jgi:hypothetical protein
MRAQLAWPSLPGLTGRFTASLQHDGLFPQTRVTVKGAHGELTCDGFVMPVSEDQGAETLLWAL